MPLDVENVEVEEWAIIFWDKVREGIGTGRIGSGFFHFLISDFLGSIKAFKGDEVVSRRKFDEV